MLFVVGNAAIALSHLNGTMKWGRLTAVTVVALMVFGRQRLLCLVEKQRGAARRERREVMPVVFGTAALEAVIVYPLGLAAMAAWAATLAFAVLSTKRFFLASWFETRRELYTLVAATRAVFLGAFVVAGVSEAPIVELGAVGMGLSVTNWSLHSLLMFTRGVQGRGEVAQENRSSGRLSPAGAAAVCALHIAIANSVLLFAPLPSSAPLFAASAVALMVALFYATEPRLDRAIIFRVTMNVFLAGFYGALVTALAP